MAEANSNVRVVPIFLYVGICLYVASFFLPAVKVGSSDIYRGWQCAYLTLRMFPAWTFLPGFINPLAIAYAIMAIANRLSLARLCLAIATLLCLIPTWMLLSGELRILLGCAMWVVSLLLMMSRDLGSWKIRLLSGGDP